MRRPILAALLGALACSSRPHPPLTLERHTEAAGLRLVLTAEPGARINARLKPALELTDGTVLRFDAPALSPDSAYFAAPPVLLLPAGTPPRGRILASVCRPDEAVCRLVTLALR